MGYDGNNGTLETDYATSVDTHHADPAGSGAFRNGATFGGALADFAQGISPLTAYNQGSSAGSYTVQAGESLSSIAANLWGDASLWYKLAEANGLSGQSGLIEGQALRVPAGVMSSAHNASTLRPYDPAATMGDTAPTNPIQPKPGKHGCGVLGTVILVVIAVVVSYFTAGAAAGAFASAFAGGGAAGAAAATSVGAVLAGTASVSTLSGAALGGLIAGGVVGGVAGSIASQAVGVTTGIQDKFSWNAVAMAGIGGGVGAGFGGGIIGAVEGNVVTQGASMALGMQSKFSWAGVAAAAAGAGLGSAIGAGGRFGALAGSLGGGKLGVALANGVIGGASAIANAAARSLIDGSDFGDNIMAALPDVIGQTIGNMFASGLGSDDSSGGSSDLMDYNDFADHLRNDVKPYLAELLDTDNSNVGSAARDSSPSVAEEAVRMMDAYDRQMSAPSASDLVDFGLAWNEAQVAPESAKKLLRNTNTVSDVQAASYLGATSDTPFDQSAFDESVRNSRVQALVDKNGWSYTYADAMVPGSPYSGAYDNNLSNNLASLEGLGGAAGGVATMFGADQNQAAALSDVFTVALGLAPAGAFASSRSRTTAKTAPLDALETWGVRPAPGTRIIPEGVPDGWRIRPTDGKGGVRYYNPKNPNEEIRVMQGDPSSPYPNSQAPYARQRNAAGTYLREDGTPSPLPRGGLRDEDAHIPLDRFKVR